ncbi:MAG: hypothetical protein Q8O34_17310 [Rhodocyclaceae bacterium]|nr:hypothetical protein [Rhodocyclaceae bacterium]
MRLILSTCGTSLLTYRATDDERASITRHANARRPEDIPADARASLEAIIARARDAMRTSTLPDRACRSAEFNGLHCFYEGRFAPPPDLHWLIATDTWLGQQTAEILRETLEALGQKTQVRRIPDLRTADIDEFRLAMAELVRLCTQEIRPMGLTVIFNLTGGFKSVQGFMQALGMLYADETVYVFEGSSRLLRLPHLPLKLDAEETVRNSIRLFQRMAVGLPVSAEDARGILDVFLFVVDNQASLSEWGEIVWAETKGKILGEKLWQPVDTRLRYGERLERSVNECSTNERVMVNERLAELARCLHDPAYNPKRLDFKKLAAANGQYTHECDAWATGNAKRLFGRFDNGVFVVGKLAEGLH